MQAMNGFPFHVDPIRTHAAAAQFRVHLHQRPFWIVQGLVMLATAIHWSLEAFESDSRHALTGLFVVTMFAIYLVPVVYASLNFGREGAIPTAVWSGILAVPPLFISHQGADRIAEALQHITILGLAVVIAGRVDREVVARRQAESEGAARRASEARYRELFESAGEAILVFDQSGVVREANAAAARLFGRPRGDLSGSILADLVGNESASRLVQIDGGDASSASDLRLMHVDGSEVWLNPVCSAVHGGELAPVIQALFHDVTEQRRRQLGLEAYTQRIIQAQEEERQRIARELHDSTLQSLVLIYRQLDALGAGGAHLPASVREELSDVRRQTEGIAAELRRFCRDLRPSILDDLGLAPALRWLVSDLEQRTGIRGQFVVSQLERRLSPDEELGLFRIAQEALRNVERHADARSVTVMLACDESAVRLTVQDDGKGIRGSDTIPRSALGGKLGLLGMQERARLLDGILEIVTAPGCGTCVQVAIPLVAPT
jgi:PAS domain S-box-containing protein